MDEISSISEISNMFGPMAVAGKYDRNQMLPAAGQNLCTVSPCVTPVSVRSQGSFVDLQDYAIFASGFYNCIVIHIISGIVNMSQYFYHWILHYIQKCCGIFFLRPWMEILIMHAGNGIVQLIKKLLFQIYFSICIQNIQFNSIQ